MPQLIMFALVGLLMALPACLIAYIMLRIFPHSSYFLLALVSIVSVIATIMLLDFWQTKKAAASTNRVSYEKVGSIGRILGLVFTSLFGVYFVFQSNKIDLFVDNQSDTEMNVSVNNEKLKLAANAYKKISVVQGKLTVKVGDVVKVLEVKEDSVGKDMNVRNSLETNWVWNINGKGTYVKTEVKYGTKINIGLQNVPEEEPDLIVITDELFKVKADFVFDVPLTIKTKNQYGFIQETRTALYRINDLKGKYGDDTMDYNSGEEQVLDDNTEDSVIVTSKKTKTKK
jgi:hypothetical protein